MVVLEEVMLVDTEEVATEEGTQVDYEVPMPGWRITSDQLWSTLGSQVPLQMTMVCSVTT